MDVKSHRAVVAADDLRADVGVVDVFPDPVGAQEIVDTPAGVVGPGVAPVAPPGIRALQIGIKEAEGVGKA